jgi:hypothetical protein
MNRIGNAYLNFEIGRDRGHVGIANLVPDEAHSLLVANETHLPITETNNTRNYA